MEADVEAVEPDARAREKRACSSFSRCMRWVVLCQSWDLKSGRSGEGGVWFA